MGATGKYDGDVHTSPTSKPIATAGAQDKFDSATPRLMVVVAVTMVVAAVVGTVVAAQNDVRPKATRIPPPH